MTEFLKLSNGVVIPHVGLGTYPMKGEELCHAVINAYNAGYRLIDTADNYYNESDLGNSLQILYAKTDAQRKDLFLVSKVSDELYPTNSIGGGQNKGKYFWKNSPIMQQDNAVHNVVRKKIEDTLNFLKTDYLDLYLMHWPYPDFFSEIWYELEQIYKEGLVRAIGVCNCRERHFEKLKQTCEILPMVNQFETSPINTRENTVKYCNENGIKVMVYSPLMSLKRIEKREYQEYLKILSQKYKKNTAQIVLRFDIQRGLIPIPKSSHQERLMTNISVFDFVLDSSEMDMLYGFNENYQYLPESKSCPGL
ncbi:MAG: aldo/keto reductase [Paludibacteraceae bacterium]|nr:aldo/keto reductase [Paludibacteraceae bacterium]